VHPLGVRTPRHTWFYSTCPKSVVHVALSVGGLCQGFFLLAPERGGLFFPLLSRDATQSRSWVLRDPHTRPLGLSGARAFSSSRFEGKDVSPAPLFQGGVWSKGWFQAGRCSLFFSLKGRPLDRDFLPNCEIDPLPVKPCFIFPPRRRTLDRPPPAFVRGTFRRYRWLIMLKPTTAFHSGYSLVGPVTPTADFPCCAVGVRKPFDRGSLHSLRIFFFWSAGPFFYANGGICLYFMVFPPLVRFPRHDPPPVTLVPLVLDPLWEDRTSSLFFFALGAKAGKVF